MSAFITWPDSVCCISLLYFPYSIPWKQVTSSCPHSRVVEGLSSTSQRGESLCIIWNSSERKNRPLSSIYSFIPSFTQSFTNISIDLIYLFCTVGYPILCYLFCCLNFVFGTFSVLCPYDMPSFFFFFSNSLVTDTLICLSFILHFPCPCPNFSHFSNILGSLLLKSDI